MNGVELIRKERLRQQRKLGWTKSHDKNYHGGGQLAEMGAFLAAPKKARPLHEGGSDVKVVRDLGWDISPHDRINELVKAGALIAAEIDRLLSIPLDRPRKAYHNQ